MLPKNKLEQLNNEQEMLNFFTDYYKSTITLSKFKLYQTYDRIRIAIEEESTKSEEIDLDAIINAAEEHDMLITIDEFYTITITHHIKFFDLTFTSYLFDTHTSPSEIESQIEVTLDEDAHFLIDLTTALIYSHGDRL